MIIIVPLPDFDKHFPSDHAYCSVDKPDCPRVILDL